jgi:hypothetical protein
MTDERKKYSTEFKREAVRLMETSGKPMAQLARELGINETTCIGGAAGMESRIERAARAAWPGWKQN